MINAHNTYTNQNYNNFSQPYSNNSYYPNVAGRYDGSMEMYSNNSYYPNVAGRYDGSMEMYSQVAPPPQLLRNAVISSPQVDQSMPHPSSPFTTISPTAYSLTPLGTFRYEN
jgi:hypothetical protein